MVKAVYPGTFDPPTLGHINIVSRGARIFDSLHIVVAVNNEKSPLLNLEMRRDLIADQVSRLGLAAVEVGIWDGLIVDYCRKIGADILLRGIRTGADLNYESEMAMLNRHLESRIETVFLPAEPEFIFLQSKTIRDLFLLGGDISGMVPVEVHAALAERTISNK